MSAVASRGGGGVGVRVGVVGVGGGVGCVGWSRGGRGVGWKAGFPVFHSLNRFEHGRIHCIAAPGSDNSCANTGHERALPKVRVSSTIGTGSAVLAEDVSPAPAAGKYSRSAGTMHDQRRVSRF